VGCTATVYVDDVGVQEKIRKAEMEYLRFTLIFSTFFSVPVFFMAKIGPHIQGTHYPLPPTRRACDVVRTMD
jgi:hypothetical protein